MSAFGGEDIPVSDGYLIKRIADGYALTPLGLSVLYGVPVRDVLTHIALHTASIDAERWDTVFPEQWVRAGRRRAGEARAQTGSTHLVDGLRYWAAKDGVTVALVDQNGEEL